MSNRLDESIRRAMRDQISESFVFPIDESTVVSYDDYDFDTSYIESLNEEYEGDQEHVYQVGDIVMSKFEDNSGTIVDVHRFLLITDGHELGDGLIGYEGFIMDSIHPDDDKSNKANPNRYPDNIYIEDYSSTLYRSPTRRDTKPCMIKVDKIIRFTNEEMSNSGTWKGTVSRSFMNFVVNRYKDRGTRRNAYKYWNKD